MLSSKCGWLVKRNEQHVWQKRWCCVVPHTFLYYFEGGPEIKDDNDGVYEGYSGGGINIKSLAVVPLQFQNLDQDQLNVAVKEGYLDDVAVMGGGGARSSFYASLPSMPFSSTHGPNGEAVPEDVFSNDWEESPLSVNGALEKEKNGQSKYQFVSSSNMQPVGIIDLECYSAVNRSKMNPTVLEVAGDSITNPDLRSFYFQSATVEDAEAWTTALLGDRHQSLKDETEAYRQVCDSFPLQLQACSEMIDAAEKKAAEMEKEAYTVRCSTEENRRKVVNTVREVLERQCWELTEGCNSIISSGGISRKKRGARVNGFMSDAFSDHSVSGMSKSSHRSGRSGRSARSDCSVDSSHNKESSLLDSVLDEQYAKLETNREDLLKELEATLSSSSNVVQPVQTLADYATAISSTFSDLRVQLKKVEKNLSQSVKQDQSELNILKAEIEKRDAMLDEIDKKHANMSSDMKSQLEQYQQEVAELTKQLDAQRMEFSMYQSANKNKVSELHQHKKILKKEVIELRKKIDESGSETTAVAHKYEKIKNSYQAEKERNATLERYVERLEKQVGVQQNMMEMMSTSGASFIGKTVGPGLTQCESKDNVSLSGSVGSQCRRDSSSAAGGHSTMGGAARSQSRPRMLLPPESSRRKSNELISPLRSPRTPQDDVNVADSVTKESRDASTTYYQSEATTELETPTEDVESHSSRQTKPSICLDDKETLSTLESGNHSSTCGSKTPKTPLEINNNTTSTHIEDSTPVQSNSNSVASHSVEPPQVKPTKAHSLPSINTSLDVSQVATFPATDPDDEDDAKSRVSDITEDRTQRQIDDDLAERRKIMLAYLQGNSTGESSDKSLSASTQRRLDTIENMMPNAKGGGSVSRSTHGLPRIGSLASLDGASHGGSSQESGKLSIAQRMRLAADNRANVHRSPSPMRPKDDTSSSPKKGAQVAVRSASPAPLVQSGSFFQKLGKSIESLVDNSIAGVKSYESDDDSGSETTEESTSVKSKPTSQVSQLTLKERIALQRQKQVEFLKNKGVIDDESSLTGGAGGSVIGSPGSVTPSNRVSTPRRGVGRTWSRN